jgi:hypothetical protein
MGNQNRGQTGRSPVYFGKIIRERPVCPRFLKGAAPIGSRRRCESPTEHASADSRNAAVLGRLAGQVQPIRASEPALALVRSLYAQVVSLHPIGVTWGFEMTTFAPFLSKDLHHRIDQTAACEADFFRQYPQTDMKPSFGWLELGLFTGDGENAGPSAFQIERTQQQKDGTVRVYVTLTHAESDERPWTWRVAAIARREDSRYVIDDVVYLKDKNSPSDARLSKILSSGCDGPRWVGDTNR